MKTILIAFMTLATLVSHAEELSFSGTVVEDQKNSIDLFGGDVEVGDSVSIEISIDLSTPLAGVDITAALGATGSIFQYPLSGRGVMDVEIGSAEFTCNLNVALVADDLVFLPAFPVPTDLWDLSATGGPSCGDLQFSVRLQGIDNNVVTNADFYLPNDLNDFESTFTVFQIVIDPSTNTVAAIEVANGTVDAIVSPSPEQLLEDLAEIILTINLQAGIANSLDSKLNTALNALDDTNENNDVAALNSMYAFCNSVEAQRQRGRRLSAAQANQLIDAANRVIAALDENAPLCE